MKTFSKYIVVQLAAYGVEMAVFISSLYLMVFGPIWSNVFSKLCAGGFAFFVQRSFTFDINGGGSVMRQAIRYAFVLLINIPISSLILALMLYRVSEVPYAKILSDIICVAISFWLSKHFIFTQSRAAS